MKRLIAFAIVIIACLCASHAQKKVTLKAGTIVPLQAVKQIKAADVNEGENVDFRVIHNIKVDDEILIPQGTIAKGVVSEAKKSSLAGTKGRLVININNIIHPTGEHIYFSNTSVRIYGQNRTPLSVVTALFLWPCIFIPGTKAVMPEGYEVQAVVASNTDLYVP